jgi:glycosyltransferase involved in cell wall biosynthesis
MKRSVTIAIISPCLPPALDGIGDYTANLAQHLATEAAVTVLCGMPGAAPIPGADVRMAFNRQHPSSLRGIVRAVGSAQPEWVVVQYCPFGFGRWGWNPWLVLTARALKKRWPETELAVTVHEPCAWPINWKLRTMNTWQRPQLRLLGNAADVVLFVVGRWVESFGPWFAGKRLYHLPVGSNIPCLPISRNEARTRLGVGPKTTLLCVFGQGHHSQLWDYARLAAERLQAKGGDVAVLHLGPALAQAASAFGTVRVISDGFLPAEEVSRRLAAVDLFAAAFADGVSTRRTTFIAALQHGLAVLGTRGSATDPMLEREDGHAYLLVDAGDAEVFASLVEDAVANADRREQLGAAARDLYEREFAWPVIARRMLAALGADG